VTVNDSQRANANNEKWMKSVNSGGATNNNIQQIIFHIFFPFSREKRG
jgi:hypothetical protein